MRNLDGREVSEKFFIHVVLELSLARVDNFDNESNYRGLYHQEWQCTLIYVTGEGIIVQLLF
jgi:hypothetical protein